MVESRTIPDGFDTCTYLAALNINSTSLSLPRYTCNSIELVDFDLSYFKQLESVTLGGDNGKYAKSFYINGLPRLKTLDIGFSAFTLSPFGQAINYTRTFLVENCIQLKSIVIGPFSFTDYSGGFEVRNNPLLESIEIGSSDIRWYSYVFGFCPFKLLSKRNSRHLFLDLPSLKSVEIGAENFVFSPYIEFNSIK